jgi:hypothetical protein
MIEFDFTSNKMQNQRIKCQMLRSLIYENGKGFGRKRS